MQLHLAQIHRRGYPEGREGDAMNLLLAWGEVREESIRVGNQRMVLRPRLSAYEYRTTQLVATLVP